MFIDTFITEAPNRSENVKCSPEQLLAIITQNERPKLRVYIGASAGVGKTYQMLEDAWMHKKQGIDIVIGAVETHGRAETQAMIGDLEIIPNRKIEYRGVILEEMDLDAIIKRRPQVVLVDELAHTNIEGSKNKKRFEDVLELLENGINVVTACNIQHLESLNDIIVRTIGIKVRETVPDSFFHRADEVINVDVSVDTLRTRLKQGKIYDSAKIEQSLNNFFRKSNLSALRELALREVADVQAIQDKDYREIQGIEYAFLPEKVMVCMASRGSAKKLLRLGARIAGRLANDWYAVYVEMPNESADKIKPETKEILDENIRFAKELGAKIVCLKGENVADELIKFAKEHAITNVIFGQSARTRWELFWKGSVINRFLKEVSDATVQVVPLKNIKKTLG
jgi:two-component system, OmpR family, sensor histidine kinase KdpD